MKEQGRYADMTTPIDFGKEFLHALYRERDLDKTMTYLSDDVVWVTPEEMLHLRTRKEIRDFVAASMGEDQKPYNVDIASIKSAPVSGDTNTIAYDVNLIPRREQEAKNLRVALTIHKKSGKNKEGAAYELVYVGMSRKYARPEAEQMQGFMENLPGGLIVLAGFGANAFRELYANTYFSQKLGYQTDEFYDLSDSNPFFMIPEKDQRRMRTLVNEMVSLAHPRPISVQVNLLNVKGEEVPFQVITKAAYKDKGGTRTILYLLFSDLSEILLEQERTRKRLKARAAAKRKTEGKKAGLDDAAKEQVLRSEAQKLYDEAEAMQERAASQLDDIDKLMNAAKEACENAEKDAKAAADEQIEKIRKEAAAQVEAARREAAEQAAAERKETAAQLAQHSSPEEVQRLTDDLLQMRKELDEAKEKAAKDLRAQKETQAKEQQAQEALIRQEEQKKREEALQAQEAVHQESVEKLRIEKEEAQEQLAAAQKELEEARQEAKEREAVQQETKDKLEEARQEAKEQLEAVRQEAQDKLEAAREEAQKSLEEAQKESAEEKEALNRQVEETKADAEGTRQGFLVQIRRYQERLAQSEQGQKKRELDAAITAREQEKSAQRLSFLLEGQMNAIESLATAAQKDSNRQQAILRQICKLSKAVPGMSADILQIARLDPAGRTLTEESFSLSECLSTVIKVIRPQCRRKGIVFTCETDGKVPDMVRANKAGLQLSFLCILENAVQHTAQGGRIRLVAQADRAVRGSCYFHFVISDTGTGIPDDKLPVLFDNPSGELSISRKVLAGMGGSILVRSNFGSGSRFEISVNMKIV